MWDGRRPVADRNAGTAALSCLDGYGVNLEGQTDVY